MFSFGFWEMLVIGVIALLVVGPERLPAVATFTGQWIGRLRRMARHMRSEIQNELEAEHMKSLLADQQSELNKLRREVAGVRDDAQAAARETREGLADIERDGQRDAGRARRQQELRQPQRVPHDGTEPAAGTDGDAASTDTGEARPAAPVDEAAAGADRDHAADRDTAGVSPDAPGTASPEDHEDDGNRR